MVENSGMSSTNLPKLSKIFQSGACAYANEILIIGWRERERASVRRFRALPVADVRVLVAERQVNARSRRFGDRTIGKSCKPALPGSRARHMIVEVLVLHHGNPFREERIRRITRVELAKKL